MHVNDKGKILFYWGEKKKQKPAEQLSGNNRLKSQP